jgi:subtilisin family serine protease
MSMLDGQTTTSFNGSTVLKAYANQPAMQLIGVDSVRGLSTGAGTRIGYIDTGVDPDHPALRPWLEPGVDLVFNRSTSEFDGLSQDMMSMLDQDMMSMLDKRFMFLLDQTAASTLAGSSESSNFPSAFGHGTMVAGLIHVVAPDARIVPIKAFDANGYTTVFTLIEAVYRAIDLDIDALNLSFSTTEDSQLLRQAIDAAHSHGIAIVASAGNDARDGNDIYPASYGVVYGVAATDLNDRLASFSNYGTAVAITAPGAFVISTVPGGRYAAAWGTSFSAPIVTGAIALRASWRGHANSDGPLVINSADPIDAMNPGFEKKLGKGRVNVRQALSVGQ